MLYQMNAVVFELAPRAADFLKAYTTQTPDAPRGAFIDARGKAVAVYDQVRLDDDRSLIVVVRTVAGRLQEHLKKYLILSDTALRPVPMEAYRDLETGGLLVTSDAQAAMASEEDFKNFRLDRGIALQGIDYDDPMLLNLADPDLVSFSKGCYLGQEIMARVHHRSKPPLRMAVVNESDCPADLRPAMTSRAKDPRTGQIRGFVFLPTV